MSKAIANLLEDERGQFALWLEGRWWLVDGGVGLWPWPKDWDAPTFKPCVRIHVTPEGELDDRPIFMEPSEASLRNVTGNWGEVYRNIRPRSASLVGTREHYRIGHLEAETFTRQQDGETVLIQLKFARMFRKLAKAKCKKPKLIQINGISGFDKLHQPVLLIDTNDKKCSLRAAVMCVRQGDAKLERIT